MLKLLLEKLPLLWTDELYSDQFRASPSIYKDFEHALKHVRKAAQELDNMTEDADHTGLPGEFQRPDVEKYLADLIICTVRLALESPTGPIDLEAAVLKRIELKMGKKLEIVVACDECGATIKCNHHDSLGRCQCSGELGPCCVCS